MALSDASPQTPSPASRQSLARRHRDRASIRGRPKTIESRGEAGHWEGDLIICKCGLCSSCMSESRGSRSPRGSQGKPPQKPSQRCSRCSVASILICEDPSLSTTTPPSPSTACSRTMRDMTTWFCDAMPHGKKAASTPMDAYVSGCRQHLDIDRTSDQDIQEIVLTTNLTPRKCLGFKTPFQALIAELGKTFKSRFSHGCASRPDQDAQRLPSLTFELAGSENSDM